LFLKKIYSSPGIIKTIWQCLVTWLAASSFFSCGPPLKVGVRKSRPEKMYRCRQILARCSSSLEASAKNVVSRQTARNGGNLSSLNHNLNHLPKAPQRYPACSFYIQATISLNFYNYRAMVIRLRWKSQAIHDERHARTFWLLGKELWQKSDQKQYDPFG